MKKTILFLDQQSWRGGAQSVLECVLDSIAEFHSIVGLPCAGAFKSELDQRGVETFTYPLGAYRSGRKSCVEMAAFAVRSVACGFKVASMVRRRRAALIYVNGPRCLPAGVFAAWLTRCPAVFHLHLILRRKAELVLARFLARRVSRVVACSQAAAAPFVDVAHVKVIYNSFLPLRGGEPPKAAEGQTKFTLGMVGRITESKGCHLLLNALSLLRPDLKAAIRLIVAGAPAPDSPQDCDYAARLRADAIRNGLADSISWTGYQHDVAGCYSLMHALVHPATDEALGLVILEALQHGIPVIASNSGGIPEVVRDGFNGLLFLPGDACALARAIERFVEDESLRRRLQAGARRGLDEQFRIASFQQAIRRVVTELSLKRAPCRK